MLDTETKRRIDTARDILVGKVPDPKSQVEQITIALIYKFMDDMDQESLAMGGKASFFTGEYAKYAWSSIFNPRLGGFEMLALYADAITSMNLNPNLPQLFRDIFKNAFLPYRDPETLKLFLKTINEFTYDHSERLGDAFEYLLSVMSSQGDAGQFRTPRHIIDFMVSVVKPQKNESILDPACGTAGFLISAYKHILADNQKNQPGDLLNPDERKRLLSNFKGYDISPDMVRLSRVNLYLHGFVQPQIYEYDTLTSQERWNDYADVILANPPFMSPKGGIKPHKRFSVQSNRSEVLFVDYMAEHLTPAGRAAIIVPEGIIFQSANAYKQLRKYLVEKDFLWAVVSLPAGVFNPYAGVKTSILFLDKTLAQRTNKILFVKIENDGFDLGAQRRPVDGNNLPNAVNLLESWQKVVRDGQPFAFNPAHQPCSALLVEKIRLAENDDYNLSADRYREVTNARKQNWPIVTLKSVCDINPQTAIPTEIFGDTEFTYIDISSVENGTGKISYNNKLSTKDAPSRARRLIKDNDVLLSTVRPNLKAFAIVTNPPINVIATTGFAVLRVKTLILPQYLYISIRDNNAVDQMIRHMGKGSYPSINQHDVESIKIPLPPMEIQRQIVDEIAAYQRIIVGARIVVEGWKPDLETELTNASIIEGDEWEVVKLGDVLSFVGSGVTPLGGKETYTDNGILFIRSQNVLWGSCDFSDAVFITNDIHQEMGRTHVKKNDVLLNITGASIGRCTIYLENREANVNQHVTILRCNDNIDPFFLMNYLLDNLGQNQIRSVQSGASRQALNYQQIKNLKISLPPLDVQHRIVDSIENERRIVESNRELIQIYEAKIQKVIARVWEE